MSKAFGRAATVKAALLMTGSTYVSFGLGMLVSALVARSLGPEEFGRYAYLVWLSGLLVMIANNGLTTTVIRFVSESIGRNQETVASDVHGWLLRAQHLSLVAVAIAFLLVLEWTLPAGWAGHIALFGGAVSISFIAKTLYLFAISTAKGAGQYGVEAASTVGMSIANTVGVAVLFLMHAPMSAYVALFAVTSVGYFVVAQLMMRRRGVVATRNALQPELARQLRQHLFWTVLLAVAAAFGNRASETFLLNRFVGPVEVGFFSVAAALTRGGIELLTAGLTTVLMPAMAHAYGAGGESRAHSILSDSVRYFGFAGLLLAGVGYMWADLVVNLMYGAQYKPVAGVLQVMVVVAGLTLPQGAFGALLSTTNHQKLRAIVAALSVVASAAAALLLVPAYGLTGAVIANAVSTLAIFVAIAVLLTTHLNVRFPWSQMTKLLAAALGSAGIVSILPWMHPGNLAHLAAGALYALALTVMSFILGAWTDTDVRHIVSVAAKYPRYFGWLIPMLDKRTRGA